MGRGCYLGPNHFRRNLSRRRWERYIKIDPEIIDQHDFRYRLADRFGPEIDHSRTLACLAALELDGVRLEDV